MGTVPIGTGEASMIAWRMRSMSRPVERSITVSAPKWTAVCSFSNSRVDVAGDGRVADVGVDLGRGGDADAHRLQPLRRWTVLAGMTIRPRATSPRINFRLELLAPATNSISGVIVPARALSICVATGDGLREVDFESTWRKPNRTR